MTKRRTCEFCSNIMPNRSKDTVCRACDEGLKHFDPIHESRPCGRCGERTPNRFRCDPCWDRARSLHNMDGDLMYFASPATYEVLPKKAEM